MARWLIYETLTGRVTNSVIWSGDTAEWSPPEGHKAVRSDIGQIGQTYDERANRFTDPPAVEPPLPVKTPVEKIADLLADRFSLASSDKEALLTTE